jgi:hypothetical protein
LPPQHPANNQLAHILESKKLYYKSIGGFTEGSVALFMMHNSASQLIGNHIKSLNGQAYYITTQIAALREHKRMILIMVEITLW